MSKNEAICTFLKDGDLYCSMTDDGGITWDSAVKINEDETVKEEFHAVDICEIGTAYADDEGIVNFNTLGSAPIVTIDSISGGIGVSAIIENIGSADAADVSYSISITGGILGMVNKNIEDTIPTIEAGGQVTITSGFFIGLGPIEITVTANSAQETISAKQLIIYTSV